MRGVALGVSACLVFAPAVAQGQGFGVHEHGTCAMSRAGAAVAQSCEDGSAIYTNPAGLAGRKGVIVSGGATLIVGSGTFESDQGVASSVERHVSPPPHAYFQYGISDRVAIGAGLYVPYGLRLEWPLDFEGRFVSYDARLATYYVQPTLAYALSDAVSVGGGLTIAVGSVTLNRREDLARVPLPIAPGLTFGALVEGRTDFASTQLSASGATGIGVNLGVVVKAHERVRAGVRYLSKITLDYEGRAAFTPVSASFRVTKPNVLGLPVGTPLDAAVSQVLAMLPDQDVRTELEMPAQFVAGLAVQVHPRVTVFGDYQWVGWSEFEDVTLDFSQPTPPDERLVQNYRNTNAVRLGVEIETSRATRVSAGYVYNQAAAPDETVTPLLPEARRHHVTAGLGLDLHANWTLDVAYQFVGSADRRGRVVNPPPGELPTVALNSGVYGARADLLGLTLTYRR